MHMQKAKFIEVIKQYPILYDVQHEDYKNSYKKDKVWDKMAEELNENSFELKKKWKSLKDTFAKYMKRVNADESPKPWVWAEQMKYFLPYLSFSNRSYQEDYDNSPESDFELLNSNSNMPVVYEENEFIGCDNDYKPKEQQPLESVLFVDESPNSPSPVQETIVQTETASFSITQPRTLKRKSETEEPKSLRDHFKEKKFKAVFDDIECLMLAHAQTIKKFSAKRQAITKYKIAQVILEQELLHVQEMPTQVAHEEPENYQNISSDDEN
ncbi:uncharacterized protein [Musca autumnalis]|uniref:uncharacterized protein n=1 Tax=Musca autumnalis TaxID=221902 RepID=UPI003CEEC9BD